MHDYNISRFHKTGYKFYFEVFLFEYCAEMQVIFVIV